MNKDTLPFSEKYRPRKIEELVLDKIILNKINNIIKYKDIPNIIFTGKSGVGKTSTIHCIARSIFSRKNIHDAVLELNASDDRGIKSVQETIINFCKKKVIFDVGFRFSFILWYSSKYFSKQYTSNYSYKQCKN